MSIIQIIILAITVIGIIVLIATKKIKFIIDDKALHVYAGIGIGLACSMLTYFFIDALSIFMASIIALVSATIAGWFKEWIWDKKLGKGTFNIWDFWCTIWGGAIAAVFFVPVIINEIEKRLNA